MGRLFKQIDVTAQEKEVLQNGYKKGHSSSYPTRCQIILLKSSGYKTTSIESITGCCRLTVNRVVNHFLIKGLTGLATKLGQGRKRVLDSNDFAVVKLAVQQERQRLKQAHKMIEENTGKKMSQSTLTRFLKLMTAVTNE